MVASLPYLSRHNHLEQIHAVLERIVAMQPPGNVHSGRSIGLLRQHDRIIANRHTLAQMTFELANAWITTGQPRTPRHAQCQLAPQDIQCLMQRATQSAQPELYRCLLGLLTGQRHNMTISLRILLEQESALFEQFLAIVRSPSPRNLL